jgi:uncharacterized protein (DUF169 family)
MVIILEELNNYKKIGKALIDKLKLKTYPVAIRMISPSEEVTSNALRPHKVFNREVPACMTYTWCRRSGFSFFLQANDIACKPASIKYFGLEKTGDSNDVYNAWDRKAGYKRNAEAEKKSRELDATLDFGEIQGFVVSPLNMTIIKPDVVMIYTSPLNLSHLILAATYDGECITSHFNGMESSCKEGIVRTYKTNECQVVSPGMGDRVLAAVQDHEMIFSIPESKLEMVLENLFLAGKKMTLKPFGIPHMNPTVSSGTFYGKPVEPGVWEYLRKRIEK